MAFKKLIWILLSLALIPVIIIVGGIFFGVIAIIIIGIIALFIFLSFVIYLNKKFKHLMSNIRTTGQEYAEQQYTQQEIKNQKTKQTKSTAKRTGTEEEIIIEQIEENISDEKINKDTK